jgi:predicted nucleotidyltransferase
MKDINLDKMKPLILKSLMELGVTVRKIILFGSRASGKASKLSDYDFLIVTEKTYLFPEKMLLSKQVREKLSVYPIDVIIKSVDEFNQQRDEIGTLVREVLKEGVEI